MTKSKKLFKRKSKKTPKRVRYYGLVTPKKGAKMAWVSVQNKNGYSLGLAFNDRTLWLKNLRFASVEEVNRAVESGIAFSHLKSSKAAK